MPGNDPDERTRTSFEPGMQFSGTLGFLADSQVTQLPDEQGSPVLSGKFPRHMHGYELLEEICQGGMGIVFKAQQSIGHDQHHATRLVAIKMILPGHLNRPYVRERFRTEAQNSARLDHPHIVPIYEVGEWGNLPFFSMKFIQGGTLADLLKQESWNTYHRDVQRRAAQLLIEVARAVHHAHQHGILHRDLKPSNILIDSEGSPNVTDFGIAKRIDEDHGLTGTGAILGTPSYMSPEQAAGEARTLTTSSDVYSLGAILYEMLVGKPPFLGNTFLETLSKVRESQLETPRTIVPVISRDLETICLKCLDREPMQRYESAGALADDLQRWLGNEPIRAKTSTTWERIQKWIRRRPGAAALVGLSMMALVAVMVLGILLYQGKIERAERENNSLSEKAKQARQNQEILEKERQKTQDQLEHTQRSLFSAQLWRVAGLWQDDAVQARQLLEDETICPPKLRDFTWGVYHRLTDVDKGTRATHASDITSLALSPNNRLMASACEGGEIKIFDVVRNVEIASCSGHTGGTWALAFDRSGERFFSGGRDGTIKVWGIDGKEQKSWQAHNGSIWTLAITSDGKQLASASGKMSPAGNSDLRWGNSEVKLWDLATDKVRTLLANTSDGCCLSMAFSPDNNLLMAGTSAGSKMLIWELSRRSPPIRTGPNGTGWVQGIAISPDGKTVAIGCADHSVRLCDILPAKDNVPLRVVERALMRGHTDELWSVAFHPGGDLLASSSWDGTIRIWDVLNGKEKHLLRSDEGPTGRNNPTLPVLFSQDGATLYEGRRKHVRAWGIPADRLATILPETQVFGLAITCDTKTLAAAGWNDRVAFWDLATGKSRGTRGIKNDSEYLFFTKDDRCLIAVNRRRDRANNKDSGNEILVWSGDEHSSWEPKLFPSRVTAALDADGETLLTASANGPIECWKLDFKARTFSLLRSFEVPDAKFAIRKLVPLRTGEFVAVDSVGNLHLFNWKNDTRTLVAEGKFAVSAIAAFPDGSRLVVSGKATLKIVDLAYPALSKELELPDTKINCLAVSSDGTTIAGGGNDETVRIWDVATGQLRSVWRGHSREVRAIAFAPSSNLLVSSAGYAGNAWWVRGGEVLLWATDRLPTPVDESYRLRDQVYDAAQIARMRGQIAEGYGDWEVARKNYVEACEKGPPSAGVWKSLGNVYFRLEIFDKSAEAYAKSLAISRSDSHTYWCLAGSLLLSNQEEAFQKHVKRMHELGTGIVNWGDLTRATTLGVGSPQMAQQALSIAEKGTQAKSTPDWQFRILATSQIRANQLVPGIKYHLESLERHPNARANILHWLSLAIAAHQRGDIFEAKKWFDKAHIWMEQAHKDFPRELYSPPGVHPNDWLEAQVLYKEVSRLMEQQKE